MNATGEVIPVDTTDGTDRHLIIGYAMQDGEEGDRVTVVMIAFAIIYATAKSGLTPGVVVYVGQDSTDPFYGCYNDSGATASNFTGWALDVATAEHDVIRIALK